MLKNLLCMLLVILVAGIFTMGADINDTVSNDKAVTNESEGMEMMKKIFVEVKAIDDRFLYVDDGCGGKFKIEKVCYDTAKEGDVLFVIYRTILCSEDGYSEIDIVSISPAINTPLINIK